MKNSSAREIRIAESVKLLLCVTSFFIFWSVLALISSIYHPLKILRSITPAVEPSSSLADSLFQEIIRSYFSLFTWTVLVIFLLAVILGFLWSSLASGRLFPFFENQHPLIVLLKRLFFSTSHATFDFSNNDALNRFLDSGNQIYGPAQVLLQSNNGILISDGLDNFRFMISKSTTPIYISFRERLVKILPLSENEFIVDLENPPANSPFKFIRLRYSLFFQNLAENISRTGLGFLLNNNPGYWKELMDSIIRLEFDSLVKMQGMSALDLTPLDGLGLDGAGEKEISRTPSHSIYSTAKPLIKPKISRNRKRGIYSLTSPVSQSIDGLETGKAAMDELRPLMSKFFENLTRTTFQIFGFTVIKIIDYQVGEKK